ncbi:MAG TPA: dihydroorotase [Phycisphaerales bacterium]|nr:dihydroorotase [Phycisphaerales bacterium]
MATTILQNGRIIDNAKRYDFTGDVLLRDGIIESISDTPIGELDCDVIDCEGCIISPGLLDIHVHFREPSNGKHEETTSSGIKSAVAGGFTTVCTMPNTTPAIDTPELITNANEEANRNGLCQVLPTACATIGRKGDEIAPIQALVEAGAIAITDDGNVVENDAMMSAVLEQCAKYNVPFMQHCQDPKTTVGGVMNEGEIQQILGYGPWPRGAEESIIERDIALNESIGASWHAQHLSSGGSVDLIRKAKAKNQPISGEASPHHLLLTDEACRDLGTMAKMNPPLRELQDINQIKEGIADGTIEILATDHAPHPMHTKDQPFANASFGIVGLDCALALYAKALIDDGVLDWSQMLAMMTNNPAALINRPSLGTLTVGDLASITVIDPKLSWTIHVDSFASTARNCPFNGWEVKGKAIATIYDGYLALEALGDRLNHCNTT